VPSCASVRSGDAGRRSRALWMPGLAPRARLGALLLSDSRLSGLCTDMRVGDVGKASSTAFLGARARLGETEGLDERSCGEYRMCPAPLTPGRDWVRAMGGAKLAADRDRMCEERGDAFRVRNGSVGELHEGELGDEGEGSVARRRLGGFLAVPKSETPSVEGLCSRRLGRGEDRNSSILLASGTGSIVCRGCRWDVLSYLRMQCFPWVGSPLDYEGRVVMEWDRNLNDFGLLLHSCSVGVVL
jgi:hypothetical protein